LKANENCTNIVDGSDKDVHGRSFSRTGGYWKHKHFLRTDVRLEVNFLISLTFV